MNIENLLDFPKKLDVLTEAFLKVKEKIGTICIGQDWRNTKGNDTYGGRYGKPYKDSDENDILFGNVYYLDSPCSIDKGYCVPVYYEHFPFQESNDKPGALKYLLYKEDKNYFVVTSLGGYNKKLFKNMKMTIDSEDFLNLIQKKR